MPIFVQDSRGVMLHTTTKVSWAEKMVRKDKATWIQHQLHGAILKLNYPVLEPPKDKEKVLPDTI